MKAALSLSCLLTALTIAGAAQAAPDPAEGEWLPPGDKAKVRIAPCEVHRDRLCGTIVWLKTPKLDAHNPDPKLRNRPIIGMPFLSGFKRDAVGRWSSGTIYDPEGGKTYDSKFQVAPNGTLKLDGCVLMFCRSQTWRRP
ncbi:MAG: DUF2147 domain-containing protein [Proteobacteria bacterium]|nr:DUF2147 domain-containing protein [Pseudomonadota bacterium]